MNTTTLMIGAALVLLAGTVDAAPTPESSMKSAGCMSCHLKSSKMIGPSFKSIGARYKGQNATATLMAKVRAGGMGNWGKVEMSPNGPDKIKDADLKAAVEYILKS